MPEEVRLWRIEDGDSLQEVARANLDLESRLESWLERDISIVDRDLLVIGRQVETDFGGIIDLLCLDHAGDVVVVELKRDKTPREITAQVLDYGSWVKDLSNERITSIAGAHLAPRKLDEAFMQRFGTEIPETLNENHRMMIVASEIDSSSERIIKYLSDTYGVNINAATFHYFKEESGTELVARIFLIEPEHVEMQSRAKGPSKRRSNLSYEELDAIADEKSVGELYRYAVLALQRYLQRDTTRSSIRFVKSSEGSRRVILSLIPQESSADQGIKFHVYFRRLQSVFNLSENEALALLPTNREPWIYYEGAEPDYEGFEGFFASQAELDRFVSGLPSHSDLP